MRKAKPVSRWLIDRYQELPEFSTFAEAYRLWEKLVAERDYRLAFNDDSDAATDACMERYRITDDVARAMIALPADAGARVAQKIKIAIGVIEEGGAPDKFEIRLLKSAREDACWLGLALR